MFVSLGYTLKDGVEIIVKGYILHPHNTHETWIVLKDILLLDIYSEAHLRNVDEINLKRVLEHVYNEHLPGLRVDSTFVYFIDPKDQAFHVNFQHKRSLLPKNQSIKVTNYSLDEIVSDQCKHAERISHAKDMIKRMK